MKRRYRQHVNPLKMTSLVPLEHSINFPPEGPIEVDLGCGDGQFTVEMARLHPHVFFLGLDIRDEFLQYGIEIAQKLGLGNVQFQTCNLIVEAPRLFLSRKIDRFYVNFPDPWFKTRHRNRRWFNSETLSFLVNSLNDNGEIFFQSDVWSIALDFLSLLEAHPMLFNRCGEWSFLKETTLKVKTSRQISCEMNRLPIWRMHFARIPTIGSDDERR